MQANDRRGLKSVRRRHRGREKWFANKWELRIVNRRRWCISALRLYIERWLAIAYSAAYLYYSCKCLQPRKWNWLQNEIYSQNINMGMSVGKRIYRRGENVAIKVDKKWNQAKYCFLIEEMVAQKLCKEMKAGKKLICEISLMLGMMLISKLYNNQEAEFFKGHETCEYCPSMTHQTEIEICHNAGKLNISKQENAARHVSVSKWKQRCHERWNGEEGSINGKS